MEVAQTPSNGGLPPPFHDHDVREWSTLDSITGVLERARIETDHWAANTTNASHKYGKVVDSRARTDADGALRQQARRQLEVFQSQVPGGHLQVIKSHSVSSSRWTNKRIEESRNGEFEGLQIPSNQLDLSFQKSKAVIGRSATRRPPTRIKNKDDISPIRQDILHRVASANSQRVNRLCHQIHENAVRRAFGKYNSESPIENRLQITETDDERKETTNSSNGHTNLLRTKSSSSEDFLINLNQDKSNKSIEDLEDLEHLQTWRRTSKIRRSLQYPKQDKQFPNKPIDLPETSVNVKKITEDFEKGRRLSTALRGNNIDLQALDQILQTISNSSSEKASTADEDAENPKRNSSQTKKNSFVTVESIQEIKGRLRRTSSPDRDIYNKLRELEADDGIVTEDSSKPEEKMIDSSRFTGHSKVKSYVFGMDYARKPIMGTGSLESRSKLTNGTTNRSEDWYNRRKSYGFEPVQNQNDTMSSNKKLVESSTDSGICRSSEVIIIPSLMRNNSADSENGTTNTNNFSKSSVNTDKDTSFGNVKRISSLFDNVTNSLRRDQDSNPSWMKKNRENDWNLNPGITIKIPIISNNNWDENEKEIKRHSIAVDETKYVSKSTINNEARRTSLVINEKFLNAPVTTEGCDSDSNGFGRKSKRVEFCKTEVHFAAESGKVNIVETDEKPPPTQNFRRRRRTPSYPADFNKNGLPVLHFGENHVEKTLFANGSQQYTEDTASGEETESHIITRSPISHGVVTVNSDFNNQGGFDDDRRELIDNENIKGILKNKMVKPKPYHLGENPIDFNLFEEENTNWSSKNFPAKDPPIWKSTVTVSNTLFDIEPSDSPATLNNQPDLIRDQFKRLSDFKNDFRRVQPSEQTRLFLSVADRIRNMEECNRVDIHKGYSTRVNIGDGQAVVIENSALNKQDNSTESTQQEPKESKLEEQEKLMNKQETVRINAQIKSRKYSPIVLRKHPIVIKTAELRSAHNSAKLSSPLLVERSSADTENKKEKNGHFDILPSRNDADDYNTNEGNTQRSFVGNEKVLRQPNISELAYFGVPSNSESNNTKYENSKNQLKTLNSKSSPIGKKTVVPTKSDSPIYQNIASDVKEVPKKNYNFDSGILDELTKAADEILQAVKDYSEEEARKQKEHEETRTELTTITENKTWKGEVVKKPIERPCKAKLKNASSNSSLETTPKDSKPTHRYISNTKASADKIKTKTSSSESSGIKATTRARRLQRASSREALLQSHGSSSEDLAANEVPLRKPRLVRKTKTTQLSMSNGMEISRKGTVSTNAKRKIETSKPKTEERIPGALPEIRHKTAVSTIRSIAEKSARDRSKHRTEDTKKKAPQQKEITKASISPTSQTKSKRETVTHRLATANIRKYRPEKH